MTEGDPPKPPPPAPPPPAPDPPGAPPPAPDPPGGLRVRLRRLTAADVAAASAWRYEGPWSVYDGSDVDPISSEKGYQAIGDERGAFLGFVCTGADARVRGLEEEEGILDVGVGLAPSLVGRGMGAAILGPVLDEIAAASGVPSMRAVVQAWNERSVRLCARLGFVPAGRHVAHETDKDVEYLLMVRPIGAARGRA